MTDQDDHRDDALPPFPQLWARWAIIAAGFAAAGSPWGPRILPSVAWFESTARSGSTLYALPGGRAVLSGGVWDRWTSAPDTICSESPDWAVDPMLNPGADPRLRTFCYWWQDRCWHRSEPSSPWEWTAALPDIWTDDAVGDTLGSLVSGRPDTRQRASVATLIHAAGTAVVTQEVVMDVFGAGDLFDIDCAMDQFAMAGLTSAPTRRPLPVAAGEGR
ncbi:hypothetical protein [Nocardia donostiensis]|uniref:Uncharacterized protein n=1 Tax=Nocardia donostiensis TaxID=1538463 RepID=A0A1W0BH35_9NOCA|nr:hypothetical protein [Nocardia donostiensis]ONM49291.1 hypothetical protein B0T46_07870 [Nocardia donostiensis]OQS14811.1 hypothetical protein B0T36_12130 [Nocardia donostiensis]OQS21814.1 hypothetical protein B0T44_06825 [Nocardia donostiensis]